MKTSDLLIIGGAGLAIYLLWDKFSNVLTGPGSLYDDTTSGIASLFPGTSPSVVVQGMINLPDGTTLTPAQVQSSWTWPQGASNPQFNYLGRTYTVYATGSPGTYTAQ